MSIRSSLLLVLLLCSVAQAGTQVSVVRQQADSSTYNLNNLEIPRWQIISHSKRGMFSWYMAPAPLTTAYPAANCKFLVVSNATGTLTSSRFTATGYTTSDHVHLHGRNDTVWASQFNDRKLHVYKVDTATATMTELYSYQWPFTTNDEQYIVPVMPLANSDSVLAISRADGDPASVNNILSWWSDDKGQTFGDSVIARDWTGYTGRKRIGLFPYDSSIAFVGDSGDVAVVAQYWDRAAQDWVDCGAGITVAADGYRCFAGNSMNDTTMFLLFAKNDCGAGYNDTIITAYRHNNTGSWTYEKILAGTGSATNPPYAQFTYIESSKRMVLIYTKIATSSNNDFTIWGRYLQADYTWSDEFQIDNEGSRGPYSYKFATCPVVPASQGDVTYVGYVYTNGGLNRAKVATIEFTEITDTIVIATLPYTLAQDSTVYTFGEDVLTSNTYGLTITTGLHNVIIDGQNDTIKFGQSGNYADTTNFWGSQDNWAVWLRNLNGHDITFRNIYFLFDPPAWKVEDSTYPLYGGVFRMGAGLANIRFENCRAVVKGRNSKIFWMDNSGAMNYNIDFYNCNFWDSCNAFYRRDRWSEQTMIFADDMNEAASMATLWTDIPFEYHIKMQYCTTHVAFWANVHLGGDSTVAEIAYSKFKTDGWNRLDGSPYDQGDVTSATENYCIAVRQGDSAAEGVRIKIHDNELTVDTFHTGGRGIFVSGVEDINWNFDDSCLAIYNNTIYAHQGFDGYAWTNNGIIIRDDWNGIRVYGNTIDMPIYDNPPSSSWGYGPVAGLRVTSNFGGNLYFKHNTIKAYFLDTPDFDAATNGKAAYCVLFEENEQNTSSLLIDSNTFFTNNVHARWGFFNGQGGNPQMLGNTFAYYDGTSAGGAQTWTAYLGYGASNTHHAYPNYYIDGIFDSSVADTHIYVDQTEPDSLSMGLKYTITATVVDTNANPVIGAIVTFTNNYTLLVGTDTTDNNGRATCLVKTWEEFSPVFANPDSTSFNPFTIAASKDGDNADTTMTIAWNAKTVTIELGATGGGVDPGVAPAVLIKDHFIIKDRVRIGKQNTSGSGIIFTPPEP